MFNLKHVGLTPLIQIWFLVCSYNQDREILRHLFAHLFVTDQWST